MDFGLRMERTCMEKEILHVHMVDISVEVYHTYGLRLNSDFMDHGLMIHRHIEQILVQQIIARFVQEDGLYTDTCSA